MMNAGRPPNCRIGGRMSGVLAKKLPVKYSFISPQVSSLTYSVRSCLWLRQVK
jgi:hypothetical protein